MKGQCGDGDALLRGGKNRSSASSELIFSNGSTALPPRLKRPCLSFLVQVRATNLILINTLAVNEVSVLAVTVYGGDSGWKGL